MIKNFLNFNFIIARDLANGSLSAYGFPPGGMQVQFGSMKYANVLLSYVKERDKGEWKIVIIR